RRARARRIRRRSFARRGDHPCRCRSTGRWRSWSRTGGRNGLRRPGPCRTDGIHARIDDDRARPRVREEAMMRETAPAVPSPMPAEARWEGLRVALVGLNAWLVCGVIPIALGTTHPIGAVAALVLAAIALAVGIFILSQDGGEGAGGLALLALF